jgi:para-nitrobenzyl esterase
MLLVAGLVVLAASAFAQTVTTRRGEVSGTRGIAAETLVFRGIPFAAPPVGPLRWAPPAPGIRWSGVLRADHFAPSCMQNIVTERKPWTYEFMAHGAISEDCLYLNVWTTRVGAGANQPVYVYLHGGGFNEGSASVPVYDGEGLARKGLVVVTVNYRLGAFGFLAHPELTKAAPPRGSGNYGLLDQIAALQWIRDNIAAFGGDPSRVTIAGQSAGGNAVLQLLASPVAKGLFHRAIVESATVDGQTLTLAEAERDGATWAEAKHAMSLAALRALGTLDVATRVVVPASAAGAAAAPIAFRPVIDGVVITDQLATLMSRGSYSDVPILIGSNLDEGTKEQQSITLAEWAASRAGTTQKAFVYLWAHALPGPDAAKYGAFHTSEVPYALNTLYMSNRPFSDIDRKIGDVMSSYWANFATTGDPNGRGLTPWPAVTENGGRVMRIGDVPEVVALPQRQQPSK